MGWIVQQCFELPTWLFAIFPITLAHFALGFTCDFFAVIRALHGRRKLWKLHCLTFRNRFHVFHEASPSTLDYRLTVILSFITYLLILKVIVYGDVLDSGIKLASDMNRTLRCMHKKTWRNSLTSSLIGEASRERLFRQWVCTKESMIVLGIFH